MPPEAVGLVAGMARRMPGRAGHPAEVLATGPDRSEVGREGDRLARLD
ncbi:hypothetical protein [Spongiactinospora sp. TRM90649]|nr:hypothetical protein [Spongiactinospora sp. TRM90649]MDF5753569.1 hypothetical protein [Spongiactinospora sp. TRM90649]